jgi:hypothetical protein
LNGSDQRSGFGVDLNADEAVIRNDGDEPRISLGWDMKPVLRFLL